MGRSYTQNMQLIIDKYRKAGPAVADDHTAYCAVGYSAWPMEAPGFEASLPVCRSYLQSHEG